MTDRPSDAADTYSTAGDNPPPADDAATPLVPTITTTKAKGNRSMVREVIETLLLAVVIFFAVRAVVLNFRVDGHSMDHSLQNNEMLLVNRNSYFALDQGKWFGWIPGTSFDEDDTWRPFGTPDRGDIIVLNPPAHPTASDQPYIKRVIGIAGDHLEIRTDPTTSMVEGIYINGIKIDEPYLDDGIQYTCRTEFCDPIDIPDGYVFVMGDNRGNSSDSRVFGLVPVENIIGKAWITYWPVGEIGIIPHEDYQELDNSGS